MRVIIPQEIDLLTTNVTAASETEWYNLITSTSTTSLTVGTGAQSLTTAAGLDYTTGRGVIVARTSAPTITYMIGTVTSYNATTGALVVNITSVAGSGAYNGWTITTNDHTYGLEDLVKVSSRFPITIYKSLRSNNIGRFPPDNLEPSTETSSSTSSVTVQTYAIVSANSTTSLAVGTGSKSLTADTGKDFTAGRAVTIARTSAPTTTNMSGTVTSYIAGTGALVVNITSVTGSGTYTDWDVTTTDTTALRTFTTQTGKNFVPGMMVEVSHSVTPNSYRMTGEVISYTSSSGELVINTFSTTGTGTLSSWSIVSQDEIGFWEEVEAANQHKMFDAYVNTKTVFPELIQVELTSERANSIALFGVTGIYVEAELWDPVYIDADWGAPSSILPAPPAGPNTQFASSAALSYAGDYLLVGVPTYTHPSGVAEAGQVRIYEKQSTGWVHTGDLNSPEPSFPYRFGSSIDLSENGLVLVVGACPIGTTGNDSGKIYIFDKISGNWIYRNFVAAPSEDDWLLTEADTILLTELDENFVSDDINDLFGTAAGVSSTGDVLVAGAQKGSFELALIGRVYSFSRYYDQWTLSQTIASPTPVDGSLFGYSVAVSPDGLVLAIGEPLSSTTFSEAGKVHVYDKAATWTARGTLQSADISADDHFGSGVSLTTAGARMVVGACGQDDRAADTGKIYIYDWIASAWVEDITFVPADGRAEDRYGSSLDIASGGGAIVVGSPMWDTGYQDTGKLYIYEPPVPYWSYVEDLIYGLSSGVGVSDWFEYFFGEYDVREDVHMYMGQIPYAGILKIEIVGDTGVDVTCGAIVLGRSQDLGHTQFGVSVGMLDFSQRVTDELGRTTISQGYWAKTNEIDLYLPNSMVDSVYKKVTSIRGIPTAWIGNNEEYPDSYFESLVVYGIFKDFSITVEGPSHSWCNLSIEGLI